MLGANVGRMLGENSKRCVVGFRVGRAAGCARGLGHQDRGRPPGRPGCGALAEGSCPHDLERAGGPRGRNLLEELLIFGKFGPFDS